MKISGGITIAVADLRYIKLDQTSPQTLTGFDTGLLKVTAGLLGIDTSTYLTSVAFADLTDYPADAAGALTNDGAGNLSWAASGGGSLLLDQTSPQTVINGTPVFSLGVDITDASYGYMIGGNKYFTVYNNSGAFFANIFIGFGTGNFTMAGNQNTFIGGGIGTSVTYGAGNTCIGFVAGSYLTTGSSNTFIGMGAGGNATECTNNLYIGVSAGSSTTTGSNNVAMGAQALLSLSTGSGVIALGNGSGYSNNSYESTYVGYSAGYSHTGDNSLFLGAYSGYFETTGYIFMIDTFYRADKATARAKALMWGELSSDPLYQTLVFNATTLTALETSLLIKELNAVSYDDDAVFVDGEMVFAN